MLIDRRTWKQHRAWAIGCVLVAVAAIIWYGIECTFSGADWPDGRSRVGFLLGIVGGVLILFEFLLWPRKWPRVRTWRIGRAQTWLRAHIWLGLLTLPIILLHTGFRFGGTFTTVLLVIFLLVIVSGVWGLVMQQLLPSRLLETVPAETIATQIPHVAQLMLREADQLVLATCGPKPGTVAAAFAAEAEPARHLVVGAVRAEGRIQGRVLQTQAPRTPLLDAEPLRDFYDTYVVPFLRGEQNGSPLNVPGQAAAAFRDLRVRVDPAAHGVVATLQDLCEQRRQFAVQARLHWWLHNWLWVHLPLSAALVVMMVVHIWYAIKWW